MKILRWLPVVGCVLLGATLAGAYPIVLLEDNFDDKTEVPGSLLADANKTPQVGTLWSSTVPTNNVWVQNEVAKDGNALQMRRFYEDGTWYMANATLSSTANANLVEPNTIATFSYDLTRFDIYNSLIGRIWIGGASAAYVNLTANGDYRGYDYNDSSLVQSGYSAGTGSWNTVELVLKWGELEENNKVSGTYDVYLTRGAGGSLPELERTLILEDLGIVSDRTDAMSYEVSFSVESYFGLPDYPVNLVYVDNVSLSVIPEPTVLFLLGAALGGFLLFRRRDR